MTTSHVTGRDGEPRSRMVDVAARAGVSVKTVSRVVNGVTTVDRDMAARVREAISELGFRPNRLAAGLKSGMRESMIGLVIDAAPSPSSYPELAAGISDIARRHGAHVITAVANGARSGADQLHLILELCRRRVGGLIVVPAGGDLSPLRREIDLGTPVVFALTRPVNLDGVDAVVVDERAGAYAATADLIGRGHTRIGIMVGSPEDGATMRQLDGVRAAQRDFGVLQSQSRVITGVGSAHRAAQVTASMLSAPVPPSALFCSAVEITVGAVEAVARRKADTAITGFGRLPMAHLMPVALTLVVYDVDQIGRAAAECLFRRIDSDRSMPEVEVVATSLVRSGLLIDCTD